MTDDLIDVYRNSKKLMPLVHLPIQSGSDKILNLMNRKHTVKKYMDIFIDLKRSIQKLSSLVISLLPTQEKMRMILGTLLNL